MPNDRRINPYRPLVVASVLLALVAVIGFARSVLIPIALGILAAGEMLARYYRHPALIHQAVQAGASWSQIAAATGSDEAQVRQGYREWADGQHCLYIDYDGKFGLNDAERAAAINRAAEPQADEHDQGWAGRGFTRRGPGSAHEDRSGDRQAEADS